MGMELSIVRLKNNPNNTISADYELLGEQLPLTDYMSEIVYPVCSELELFEHYDIEYEEVVYKFLPEEIIIDKLIPTIFTLDKELSEKYKDVRDSVDRDTIYKKRDNLGKITSLLLKYFVAIRQGANQNIKILIT